MGQQTGRFVEEAPAVEGTGAEFVRKKEVRSGPDPHAEEEPRKRVGESESKELLFETVVQYTPETEKKEQCPEAPLQSQATLPTGTDSLRRGRTEAPGPLSANFEGLQAQLAE